MENRPWLLCAAVKERRSFEEAKLADVRRWSVFRREIFCSQSTLNSPEWQSEGEWTERTKIYNWTLCCDAQLWGGGFCFFQWSLFCAPWSQFSVHRGNDNTVRQDRGHHVRTLAPLQRPEKFHFSSGGVNMVKHSPSKIGARELALWKSRSSHRACSLMVPCVLLELLHTDLLKEGCKKRFLWHFHQTVVARRPRISFLFFSFFFLPWEHLMRAQILRPRRSHASCSTFACHPPFSSSLFLSGSLIAAFAWWWPNKNPNPRVATARWPLKAKPERGTRWGVDSRAKCTVLDENRTGLYAQVCHPRHYQLHYHSTFKPRKWGHYRINVVLSVLDFTFVSLLG